MASHWKDVGLALRLHPDTLNDIEADCRDVKSCLRETLATWLKQAYDTDRFGLPSWKLLVSAVSHPGGGNNPALAQQIAENHNGMCWSEWNVHTCTMYYIIVMSPYVHLVPSPPSPST